MLKTKENYYQGVDRTILIELKKIYQILKVQAKIGELSQIEAEAYKYLRDVFEDALYRSFLQGDNEFNFVNDMDKVLFMNTIVTTLDYVNVNAKSTDDYVRNRLQVIYDMDQEIVKEQPEYEFAASGLPVDLSEMSEEDFKRAVKEFSEGSTALEQFLSCTYQNKVYIKACCIGHDYKNGTKSLPYIAFDFGEKDEQKIYLMSKAFEMGMEVAFIDFQDSLGFNIMLSPYDIEKQIMYLTESLKRYKGNETINPVITNVLGYMKKIGHSEKRDASIKFFKEGNHIGIEEYTPINPNMRGVFNEEQVLQAYSHGDSTILKESIEFSKVKPQVTSRDVAKYVLSLFQERPGRFCDAMKMTLNLFGRMTGLIPNAKEVDFK